MMIQRQTQSLKKTLLAGLFLCNLNLFAPLAFSATLDKANDGDTSKGLFLDMLSSTPLIGQHAKPLIDSAYLISNCSEFQNNLSTWRDQGLMAGFQNEASDNSQRELFNLLKGNKLISDKVSEQMETHLNSLTNQEANSAAHAEAKQALGMLFKREQQSIQRHEKICKWTPSWLGLIAANAGYQGFQAMRQHNEESAKRRAETRKAEREAQNLESMNGEMSHDKIIQIMQNATQMIRPEAAPRPQDLIYNARTQDRLAYMRAEHLKNARNGYGLHNVLLYGPAGTGKSGFAESFAHDPEFTVIKIAGHKITREYSFNLLLYYVKTLAGVDPEPEKNQFWKKFAKVTSAAWRRMTLQNKEQVAQKRVIVIVDEAEPFFKELNSGGMSGQILKNSFLANVGADPAYSFVFTTNRVWELESSADKAIYRRLHNKYLVDTPDSTTRQNLIRMFTQRYVKKSYPGLDSNSILDRVFDPNDNDFLNDFNTGMKRVSADELRVFSHSMVEAMVHRIAPMGSELDPTEINLESATEDYKMAAKQYIEDMEEGEAWRKKEESEEEEKMFKKLEKDARLAELHKKAYDRLQETQENAASTDKAAMPNNYGYSAHPSYPAAFMH
ncbi:MAG: AAA family ATPase [Zetaproteobacteria bacterium]|nr:AAA family ATPase [Zetaproteobacteria bacterium]